MKRTRLPSKRAVGTPTSGSLPKLRLSTLALAAAVTFGFASPDALALALGRVTVQSALGEPLRAEIDVPQITPEEVSSLRANIAEPPVFRDKGLDYSQALAGVTITLQRRPNGSYFLQLASDRPVNDPFVDVILDATWQSGRVQRDFTMLFDPPVAARQSAPAAPLAAQVTPAAPVQRSTPAPAAAAPAPAPAAAAPAARPAAAPSTGGAATARAPAPAAAPAPARAPAAASPTLSGDSSGKRVTVQSGDTAGRIASANKPASVSLDQMLVALLRANPDAFIDGNVNRLKAGAVLDVPSGDQASGIAPEEARQTVVAQSRDFNEFRRRLAEGLPAATTVPSASRQASGRVQAQVEDKKAATASPDKLTLSKGAVQGKPSTADQIARERAQQDSATRVAELNKNIADLNKLTGTPPAAGSGTGAGTGAGTGTGARPAPGLTAPPGVSAPAATAPAAASARAASAAGPATATTAPAATRAPAPTAPAPAPVVAAAPAPAAPAPAIAPTPAPAPVAATPTPAPAATPTPAPAPASTATTGTASTPAQPAQGAASAAVAATAAQAGASAPVAAAPPAAKPAPAPLPSEPSLLDDVLENPLIPALAVGLLAVLLGFGFYKMRQKRKSASVDSSFLESRLQPDSFFGASGGQRIDTAETNNPTGSSMVYSPSQLDAAGDVDPVAEADVYLAYGRDLQAEEILKEALRINPQRVAIHGKLLEIYAKRRDAKAFEVVAAEAYNLTQGTGTEWDHICELGRELDASNPMYRPGGQPGAGAAAAAAVASPTSFNATRPIPAQPAPAASDIDLDLDFSLGDEPDTLQPPAPAAAMPPPSRPPVAAAPARAAPAPMDFSAAPSLELPSSHQATQPVRLETPDLTLNDNSLNFDLPPPAAAAPAPAPAPVAAKGDMLEFDLGGLSLDLPPSAPAAAPAPAPTPSPAPVAAAAPTLSMDALPALGGADTGLADGGDSPLATKLSLAEEFNAIGDTDGARSLAEEVLAEASGDLKSRAQRLLAEIG
ncbi:MAG: hypothetical protein K0S57_4074 [Ramlibacter sp.]|nr:hypothetical protein [Ramlibacter sp.]